MKEMSKLLKILWKLDKPSISSFRQYDIDQAEKQILQTHIPKSSLPTKEQIHLIIHSGKDCPCYFCEDIRKFEDGSKDCFCGEHDEWITNKAKAIMAYAQSISPDNEELCDNLVDWMNKISHKIIDEDFKD